MTNNTNDVSLTFWKHVEELRRTLFYILMAITVGIGVSLFFYKEIIDLAKMPLENKNLVLLSPLDGITIIFKTCFWVGCVTTSPIWLFFIFRFIAPAVSQNIRTMFLPFLLLSSLFLSLGFLFSFFITIPLANSYLEKLNSDIGINLWSLNNYLDYTLFLLLANGLVFEVGLLMLFLVHLNIVSAEMLNSKRRYFIVLAFILSAILTPPDVLSQILLAVPIILLYELAIFYAKIRQIKSCNL